MDKLDNLDNLDICIVLLKEVQEARKKAEKFKKEYEKAAKLDKESGDFYDYTNRNKVTEKYGNYLSKSMRNDYLRIVRNTIKNEYEK